MPTDPDRQARPPRSDQRPQTRAGSLRQLLDRIVNHTRKESVNYKSERIAALQQSPLKLEICLRPPLLGRSQRAPVRGGFWLPFSCDGPRKFSALFNRNAVGVGINCVDFAGQPKGAQSRLLNPGALRTLD